MKSIIDIYADLFKYIPIEPALKSIEFEGVNYPITNVERDFRGNIRSYTVKGILKSKKKVPMYNYKTGVIS